MNDILQYKDYLASLSFSTDDEVFYGKILGIDDLVTFEGTSVKELQTAFQDAAEDYITTCHQVGKEPNKTYKGTFNVRIPSDLHKAAAVYAAHNNISLNDFVKTAIGYALQNQEDVNKQIRLR